LGEGKFLGSGNFSLPADRFQELGGFDPKFLTSENRDFCDRWQAAGYRLTYAKEALVYHDHYLMLRTFWLQHINYGRGAFRFHRKRALCRSEHFKPEMSLWKGMI
jgi:GT2 family glycosyltransferase